MSKESFPPHNNANEEWQERRRKLDEEAADREDRKFDNGGYYRASVPPASDAPSVPERKPKKSLKAGKRKRRSYHVAPPRQERSDTDLSFAEQGLFAARLAMQGPDDPGELWQDPAVDIVTRKPLLSISDEGDVLPPPEDPLQKDNEEETQDQ